MLRPILQESYLEQERLHCVEITLSRKSVRQTCVVHCRAAREERWHGVVAKKTKHLLRLSDGLYPKQQKEEGWHKYHVAPQKEEEVHRYRKVARGAREDRHGYHSVQQEKEDQFGYRKARHAKEDRPGYHKAWRQEEDRHRYDKGRGFKEDRRENHKARRAQVDRRRSLKAQREELGQHGYHRPQRGEEDKHGYHRPRREEEDLMGYQKARQVKEDGHGYRKAWQQEDDRHRYDKGRRVKEDRRENHKARGAQVDRHRSHKAQREEVGQRGYHRPRRGEEVRHEYHRPRREEEESMGYQKTRQVKEDGHGFCKAQRQPENGHGFYNTRRVKEDRNGYRKVRQAQMDRHLYYRVRPEEGDSFGYHMAQSAEENQHGYHKAWQEEKDWHAYHTIQREKQDWNRYPKVRQVGEDHLRNPQAWQAADNARVYHIFPREEDDWNDFKERKAENMARPTHALRGKTQLKEERSQTEKSKNMPQQIREVLLKTHHQKNKLQSINQKKLQADTVAMMASIKACAKDKDLSQGSIIHADIMTKGLLKSDIFLGSALINMYAKCGALEKAQEVFDRLPVQNVVSWTALIAGYALHGHVKEAVNLFEVMQVKGFSPDAFAFACVLKACTSVEAFDKGKVLHGLIVKRYPLIEENAHVGTVLVDMYSKLGALEKAQKVFDKLPFQDVVSWTALIAGYAQHERGEEALIKFEQMQDEGFFPDAVTFACVLKACGSTCSVHRGQRIHAQVVRHGLTEGNMFIGTALVDMYGHCGMLAEAQDSFDSLRVWDVVSWSALIGGYAQHGYGDKALQCFAQMQHEGFTPDVVTLTYVLQACGSVRASNKGQEIYALIVRERMLDVHVGTVLVDMYVKCGEVDKAKEVFGKLEGRDVVLWTTLIAGYIRHRHEEEALDSFEQMQVEGFYPDAVTFASILKACGSIGAVHQGQKLHAEIMRHGLLENGKNVGTAVVDMYANLGMLVEAQEVFDKLGERDLISWSVLIAGYAQLGKDKRVFRLFDQMIQEGRQPDPITFIAVLNTCSHRGLVDEGQFYFELISKEYGMFPVLEHHTCIIDLFGRAGHLDKAVAVISDMSFSANLTLWHTLLGVCQKWRDIKLGSWAFEHAVQLSKGSSAPFVSLRNIYSDVVAMENGGTYGDQKSVYAEEQKNMYTWT